ncbi:hypothetical protein CURTO8I2_150266 [Curtobacterium sp. 8I-2]|nr:hypothetical protein CURTO8I2_150266 [Curtobacterium sp. 8I-2]
MQAGTVPPVRRGVTISGRDRHPRRQPLPVGSPHERGEHRRAGLRDAVRGSHRGRRAVVRRRPR